MSERKLNWTQLSWSSRSSHILLASKVNKKQWEIFACISSFIILLILLLLLLEAAVCRVCCPRSFYAYSTCDNWILAKRLPSHPFSVDLWRRSYAAILSSRQLFVARDYRTASIFCYNQCTITAWPSCQSTARNWSLLHGWHVRAKWLSTHDGIT